MRRPSVRSAVVTGALVLLASLGWLYLAPTSIGGSTPYVVTSGISMEPLFHTGDLALVRPASQYRVGEIVAYHSTLLHVIVLHRIVAIHGGRFTFKGDNNHFLDPTHPTRALLVGRLWMRIPHGGALVHWLHRPLTGALLAGGLGLIFVLGAGETHRRRRRRRKQAAGPRRGGAPPMTPSPTVAAPRVDPAALLGGCALAGIVCACLAALALTRPAVTTTSHRLPYTQEISYSYRAAASPGPVYPSGTTTTGQPVFLALSKRVQISASYRLLTHAAASISGTEALSMRLTGPTGWSRTIPLSPPRRFTGTRGTASVTLDLPSLESLLGRVTALTGAPVGSNYGVAVVADVHVHGAVAQVPIHASFAPAASFDLTPVQFQPGASDQAGAGQPGSPGPSPGGTGLQPRSPGAVSVAARVPNRIGVGPVSLAVVTLRLLALAGLTLSIVATALFAILF
ncbi:MAG: signal peptidase I, partial [Solirubrobacteraceae bacterium]